MLTIEQIRGEFYIADKQNWKWHKHKFKTKQQAERYKTSLEESMSRSSTAFNTVKSNFVDNTAHCRIAQTR